MDDNAPCDAVTAGRTDPGSAALAESIAVRRGDRTVCCAESFTAGLLAQALAAVESSGQWFDGSIVTYRSAQKRSILGVSASSVISEQCAIEMARGASSLFSSQIAVATTGVAGPGTQDGRPVGTVILGWAVDGAVGARTLQLSGSPEEIITVGVRSALATLVAVLSISPA